MAAKVRIVHNSKGYEALLKSAAVLTDLERRAQAVADEANRDGLHVVRSEVGRKRARAAVVTGDIEAMKAEARHRNLTRAIDAGRG